MKLLLPYKCLDSPIDQYARYNLRGQCICYVYKKTEVNWETVIYASNYDDDIRVCYKIDTFTRIQCMEKLDQSLLDMGYKFISEEEAGKYRILIE